MCRIRCACACLSLALLLAARLPSQESCPALTVPKIIPGSNIFSEEQEMVLGDAVAANIEQSITAIQNPELTAHLQAIVNRLAQNLPPNQIQFRVKLIDVPTAEAFSIAGGHIYISRKIVAMTRSEDEMAGVLAHEMGHIVAHHAAIETSEEFRKVLHVTQVGDREDVTAKWNQFLSNYRRQRMQRGDYEKAVDIQEREQLQADTIALYLVTRAGYSPQAFEAFFDRLAETKGNAGGFWSNLFGTTKPDSKRLGQIIKNTPAMPKACVSAVTDTAAQFEAWKKSVVEDSAAALTRQESIPGLISKRVLTERLRPETQVIRISPDGKYVLAQDDSNAFVLTRQPLQPIFRFDAGDADAGQFTPDSRGIVLLFDAFKASPRVERWDISSQKRLEVHEVYVRGGCLVSKVAPDGKTLACLTREPNDLPFLKFGLDLYDVATGTSFFHKKDWVSIDLQRVRSSAGFGEVLELWNAHRKLLEALAPMAFSPDGHYFVAHSRQNTMAMDLFSRNPIELPGNIKSLLDDSFVFLANGRLMGVAGGNGEKSEVVEFPGGNVTYKDLNIGGSRLEAVAHGDHVLLRPIKDHPVGIFDLKQNKLIVASKKTAIDLWDNTYIAERLDGDLQVVELSSVQPLEHVRLPDSPLGHVRASALSPDLDWLAISQKSGAAVWNLQTGQRLYYLRGFSAAYFSPDGALYADFPKYLSTERTIARAALTTPEVRPQQTIDEGKRTIETGKYLLTLLPAKENNTFADVTLELRGLTDNQLLWTKHFPHERPGYHVDFPANSLVLYWKGNSQAAHSIAKDDPAAAAALAQFKDKEGALFVQVLDLDTGETRAQLAFDTGNHSFQVVEAIGSLDRLVAADDQNRVLVYSFDGRLKGTIAGHSPEISAKGDLLTVRTERGELELYDLANVQKRATYDFSSRVAFNGFSADGKRLLVLTSDQVVYTLEATAKIATNAVATK